MRITANFIIALILIVYSGKINSQSNGIPESCIENLIGNSIYNIVADSTISTGKVNSDSTEFLFLFGVGSHLPDVFHSHNIQGAPLMDVDVKDGKIERIFFHYLSIGDIRTTDEIVTSILRDHFCLDIRLEPNVENKLSYRSIIVGDVRITIFHFWEVGLEDIITIEYEKLSKIVD